MTNDLLEESARRIAEANPNTAEEVRHLKQPVIGFSEEMRNNDAAMKKFLFNNMYRHYKLNRMTSKARRVVRDLFMLLVDEPGCLPTEWQIGTTGPGTVETAHEVADYLAGMTDRSALDEHRRLFDLQSRV